eukprot:1038642-Pleurochrysis_carterae.AAC.1
MPVNWSSSARCATLAAASALLVPALDSIWSHTLSGCVPIRLGALAVATPTTALSRGGATAVRTPTPAGCVTPLGAATSAVRALPVSACPAPSDPRPSRSLLPSTPSALHQVRLGATRAGAESGPGSSVGACSASPEAATGARQATVCQRSL